jgi:broad specificity phosphatase PhoE
MNPGLPGWSFRVLKELLLIRHCESEHLVRDLTGGWTDTALTEGGREQAGRTGARLARLLRGRQYGFFCSDLLRTRQTSEIIAGHLGCDPVPVFGLRDTNNGAAANCTRSQAFSLLKPITEPLLDWIPYPGAESWRCMHDRVTAFLKGLHQQGEETALLVMHANNIVAAIHWWLELSDEAIVNTSFEAAPGSLSWLSINDWGNKTISKLNDTCHLFSAD